MGYRLPLFPERASSVAGQVDSLYFFLTGVSVFFSLLIAGLVIYFAYSRSRSHVGRGLVDVPELDEDAPPTAVPPMPGAPAPGSAAERA